MLLQEAQRPTRTDGPCRGPLRVCTRSDDMEAVLFGPKAAFHRVHATERVIHMTQSGGSEMISYCSC